MYLFFMTLSCMTISVAHVKNSCCLLSRQPEGPEISALNTRVLDLTVKIACKRSVHHYIAFSLSLVTDLSILLQGITSVEFLLFTLKEDDDLHSFIVKSKKHAKTKKGGTVR